MELHNWRLQNGLSSDTKHSKAGAIHGYHIYKDIWTPQTDDKILSAACRGQRTLIMIDTPLPSLFYISAGNAGMCACMHVHVCVHACARVCACVHVCVHVCACVHVLCIPYSSIHTHISAMLRTGGYILFTSDKVIQYELGRGETAFNY